MTATPPDQWPDRVILRSDRARPTTRPPVDIPWSTLAGVVLTGAIIIAAIMIAVVRIRF